MIFKSFAPSKFKVALFSISFNVRVYLMSTEAERRRICVKRLVYLNEPEGGERAEPDIHCWATYDAGCCVKM